MPTMYAQNTPASQQAAAIFAAFTGTTYQPNSMDVQHEPLYDTLTLAAGAQVLSAQASQWFFANPSGKTINQTNVQKSQQLPAPEAFAVFCIQLEINENALLADLLNLKNNMALEFWIGQKSYNRARIPYYNAGAGLSGYFTTGATSLIQNGVASNGAANPREINIVIDNQASFFGQYNGSTFTLATAGAGGTGLISVMTLDGLHARGVQ